MHHITLISVGCLKEKYWKDAEKEYTKRLSQWATISIKEIKEIPFTANTSKEAVLKKEGELILTAIPRDTAVIVLDVKGKAYTSEEFSSKLEGYIDAGTPLTLVIGGPLGIDKTVLEKAALQWSLSPLTVTHQIARVLVHEQLYRAFCIMKNKTYHY